MMTSEGILVISVGRLIEILNNIPQQFYLQVDAANKLMVSDHRKIVGYIDLKNEDYFDKPTE